MQLIIALLVTLAVVGIATELALAAARFEIRGDSN